MWVSATTSDRRRAGVAAAAAALVVVGTVLPAAGGVRLSREEALELAFPGCETLQERAYLSDAQLDRVERAAGSRPTSAVVVYYRGLCDGKPAGTAWFDVHRVRTLPEVLMVVVDPAGEVRRVEVLAFREPPEYQAPERWLRQFSGRALDGELRLKQAIHGITGATLTARAVTEAVRRSLALREVLMEEEDEKVEEVEVEHPSSDEDAGPSSSP